MECCCYGVVKEVRMINSFQQIFLLEAVFYTNFDSKVTKFDMEMIKYYNMAKYRKRCDIISKK